jgi:hypothetical protein
MIDMRVRRRFFAEELEAVCRLRSPALVDAFAAVPREQFLPPGPWMVMADSDVMAGMRVRATRTRTPRAFTTILPSPSTPRVSCSTVSRGRWASGLIRSTCPPGRASCTLDAD